MPTVHALLVAPSRRPCRHCQIMHAPRARGLCWFCYNAPGVREQYPSTSVHARHGVPDYNGRRPLPTEPTDALPGTVEKVAVLEERAKLGVALWHPGDGKRTS